MSCINQLTSDVLAVTPGISREFANNIILRTIAEFLTISGAWREVIGPAVARPGLQEYELEPTGGMIIAMTELYYNKKQIPFRQFAAASHPISWGTEELFSGPCGYGIAPNKLALYSPNGEVDDKFSVVVAKTTCRDADKMPQEVATTWYEPIFDGILGKLYSQPKKPWSNPQMAAYHLRRFRNGTAAARDLTRHNHSSAETEFMFPNWA